MNTEIIERLRNDEDYYGEFGQQFLSNSSIRTLLRNPKEFGKPTTQTLPMLHGSYLHMKVLEPHRESEYPTIKTSTRNTAIYKEAKIALSLKGEGVDWILLLHEKENLDKCASAITSNMELYDMIRGEGVIYEEPGIKEIFGNPWKAKRDIGWHDFTVDIKTTSDIQKFKWSARDYNYDSQAWVYQQIFGVPMVFIVVDKKTHQTGFYTCSDAFLERGKQKVMQATAVYDTYFGPNATEDINNHMIKEEL